MVVDPIVLLPPTHAEGLRYRKYAADEVDAIAGYCMELKRCFYVPIAKIAGEEASSSAWVRP